MSRPPTCLPVLFAVAAWLERERQLHGGYFQQPAQLQASAYAAIRHTTRRTTSFTGTFGTEAFCQDIALKRDLPTTDLLESEIFTGMCKPPYSKSVKAVLQ